MARLAIAWLMAVVIPLHGLTGAFAIAAGPLHTHVAIAAPTLALVDLRRAFAAPTRVVAEPSTVWQHELSHLTPKRHVHTVGDSSVVIVSDPLDDKQPNKADFQATINVAIVPSIVEWTGFDATHALRSAVPWSPTTAHVGVSERPPRAA